jgi:hypothetical protein
MDIIGWILALPLLVVIVVTWEWWKEQAQPKPPAKGVPREPFSPVKPPVQTCPTCGGTRVRNVGPGERVVSGVAGGLLFSKKARAQRQCLRCKYYW